MKIKTDKVIEIKKLNKIIFFTLLLFITYYFYLFVSLPVARDDKMGMATGGAYFLNISLGSVALLGTIYSLASFLLKIKRQMRIILILSVILIIGLMFVFCDFDSELLKTICLIAFGILIFSQVFILWKLKKTNTLFYIVNLIVMTSFYLISLTEIKFSDEYQPDSWEYSTLFNIIALLNILIFVYIIIKHKFQSKKMNKIQLATKYPMKNC
ncbi:hypothetical protein VP395_00495 [Mariniflexile soesokkakense]|uniref:Uncharacterized protein n=1 Tax=Mariniflexile soesokkakense TaxID=1343160 RepID=A0ABV0A5U8_9FLAO